jgi:hypothetical protein
LIGPLTLHWPQVGELRLVSQLESRALVVGASSTPGRSCDTPVQPVSRSMPGRAASAIATGIGFGNVQGAPQVQSGWQSVLHIASSLPSHCSGGVTVLLPQFDGVDVGAGVVVGVGVGGFEPPVHCGGYGPSAGAPAALTQSALNSVTQSTQATMSFNEPTAPPHAGVLPGGSTLGQFATKPICAVVRSSGPPQALSGPPQALQIFSTFLASALAMLLDAIASGHDPEPFASAASVHLPSAFRAASKNLTLSLPMAR